MSRVCKPEREIRHYCQQHGIKVEFVTGSKHTRVMIDGQQVTVISRGNGNGHGGSTGNRNNIGAIKRFIEGRQT